MTSIEPLEKLWGDLLSREPDLVKNAFEKLDHVNRKNVINHLKTMIRETGWHKEQKKSARAALNIIDSNFPKDSHS
jgi:hypothetical protein